MTRSVVGRFPVFTTGQDQWFVDLFMATPPGAKFQSISGFFTDDAGALAPFVGRWLGDAAGAPRPYIAGVQGPGFATGGDPHWFRTDANNVAYTRGECEASNGNNAIFDDQSRYAQFLGTAGSIVEAIDPDPVYFFGEVKYSDPGIACGAYSLLGPVFDGGIIMQALAMAGGGVVDKRAAADDPAILIHACGGAFTDPSGLVWLEPGDIGNSAGQVPPLAANNGTGLLFEQHPSVFIRQTNAIRGNREWWSTDGATLTLNPFTFVQITDPSPNGVQLRTVDRAPLGSEWIFLVEGEYMRAIIPHPAGSDLRRPRDVWDQVIAGAIQTYESVGVEAGIRLNQTRVIAGANVFEAMGRLRHLKYIQAGMYVRPWDATSTKPWTIVPQT